VRRRIVPVICGIALLSLVFVDSCTGCAPDVRGPDGEIVALPQLAGYSGMLMLGMLSLWIAVLAGVLASDHLAEPLADGSANLLLARPISRSHYAAARLLGSWSLAAITGGLLLLTTAWLLQARQGLPAGPALLSIGVALLNSLTVAGFAMALSLGLGRTLTALVVFASVWGLAAIELLVLAPIEVAPWIGAVASAAPPLLAGVLAPLAVWLGPEAPELGDSVWLAGRALLWCAVSVAALVLAFRRTELGR
jgi:ABC-type Na+ efflux pump permease subunit